MSLLFIKTPIGLLSDEDAETLSAHFDAAPVEDKPLFAAKLNEYRNFREHFPRPFSADEQRAALAERQQVEAIFDDFDAAAAGTALPTVEMSDGPEKETRKRDLQNRSFIRHMMPAVDPETAERDYELLRDGLAAKLYNGRGKGDDAAFHVETKAWLQKGKDTRALYQSIEQAAQRAAAFEGMDMAPDQRPSFLKWQEEAQKLPGYDMFAAGKYQADYLAAVSKAREGITPLMRDEVNLVWRFLAGDVDPLPAEYGPLAERLIERPREEVDAILGAVAARAKLLPPEKQEGIFARAAMAANRGMDAIISGLTVTGVTGGGDAKTSEELAKENRYKGVVNRLRNLRQENIAPIAREGGGWLDRSALAVAGSIPSVIVAGAATPWALVGQFENDAFDAIRRDSLKAGVDEAEAEKWAARLAPTAGVAMGAIEKATFGLAKGPLGGVQRAIIGGLAESAIAKRLAAGVAVEATEQWGQEVIQQAIPAIVQDAANALGAPVPDAEVIAQLQETVTDPATLAVSIVFALGGMGDMPRVRRAAEAKRAGFTPEATDKLVVATTPEEIKTAWMEGLKTRKPQDSKALAEEIRTAAEDQQRSFTEGGVAAVERTPEGWEVVLNDGTRTKVESADAARVLVDDLRMVRAQQEADAMVELAESFAAGDVAAKDRESRQQFTGDVVVATEEGVTAVRPGGSARVVTFDAESLANLHQEMAMRPEGERAAAAVILGENEYELRQRMAGDVNDLVVSLTTRQHAGSRGVLTQVHERAEAMLRAGMARGTITEQEAKMFVADAAQLFDPARARTAEDRSFRERVQRVARGEGTATELRETVSELVVADVLGRRKDGGRLPAGAITRGVDEAIRRATKPEEVTALGKFRAFLRAARDYFGQMFRAAAVVSKARREGKLFEGDDYTQFVDKLLGLDEQRAHNEAVVEAGGPAAAEAADVVARGGAAFSIAPAKGGRAFSLAARPENTIPPQEAFASAVERFGLTRDIAEAGYILPDGRLLDFTGRADAGYVRKGDYFVPKNGERDWMKGQRSTDHREIEWKGMPDYKETWMPMVEFMAMGAVRIDKSGAITLHGRNGITAAQKARLADLLVESGGEAALDMEDDSGKRAAVMMEGAKIGKLAGFIQRWKDGWTPEAPITSFSIASADYLERLAPQLQAKGLPPKERQRMFQRAQEQVAGMARAMRENDSTIGALRVAEIERERIERRKAREDELVGEIENRLGGILSQPELAQAQNGPLISRFLVKKPGEKFFRGTLLSKSAARKAGRDFRGEYDGAQGLPSWLFGGGTEGPDTAAQEAFEAGLIAEPTPDALWDGIREELAQAGRMAKALTEAKAEVAEAKRTAATETREWAAKQRAALPRKQAGREKGEVMRALATLDAILMQFPPEVRGKVGGFYSVAKATTNEAREEALRTRVEKLDKVLEQHLRKEYTEELAKIFERAKPKKEAGKKPAGKAGADVHALFDALRDVQGMTADQVAGRVSDLATQLAQGLADGTITPEQEAMIERQVELTQLLGDWKNADAARMAEAVDAAHKTLADGLLAWTAHKVRQRERRATERASLRTDTGGLGPLSERKEEFDRQNGFLGMLKKWALNLSSFEQVMNFAFGKDSTVGKRLLEEESTASNQKADEEQGMADALQDLFTRLAGGSVYRGERLRWELSQRTLDGGRAGKMSPLEAIQATMMWRQPDGRRHMEGKIDENGQPTGEWHYDQAWVDSIEKQLSDEAKAVRDYLSNEYADEWETLNPLFRERHGVNLPQHANYSPLSVTPAFAKEGQMVDPVSGMTQPAGSSLTPGSLRTRSQTAVAEPDFKDALQLFIGHRKQMIHWRAYGGLAPEMSALLNDRGVGNSVEAKGGEQAKSVLRGWVNYFTEGGTRDAQAHLEINNSLNRMVRRASGAALIGRASTLMIQSTQLAAASVQMPLPAYLARFGKLMTGNLEWGAALRSPYIQRRLATMPAVVREGMMGLEAGEPSRLRHEVARMGRLISGADALFTAGTYAILFDYHHGQAEKQGIYGAAADSYAHSAAEAATDRVAQPTRAAQRSILEATSTNPIFRASWAFASEARQKLAMAAWAAADWKNPAQAAKVLALTWGVGGLAAQIIRNIFRDIRDDDDEEWFDEKNWSPKRLAFAALTGPLQGLPILGEAIELAAAKATGQFAPEGSLLSGLVDAAEAIHSLPKAIESGEPIEETIRKVESLMSGMAMADDRIAAMASVAHVATDLFRTLDAMVETEGEAGAKQLRKERKEEKDVEEAKQEAIPEDLKEAKEVAKKLKKEAEVKAAAVRAAASK